MSDYIIIIFYVVALLLFFLARPTWRRIGPSLVDALVIGLALYAAGAMLVWVEGLENSRDILWIGITAAISGTFGAAFWSWCFRRRLANLDFLAGAKTFRAYEGNGWITSAGLVATAVVSLIFLIAVFSNSHIRSLLIDGALHGGGAFTEARLIVSSGTEGYFAPGYVKQFRDILLPILCVAILLSNELSRYRYLLAACFLIGLTAVVISGQRLVVVQWLLCFGTAIVMSRKAGIRPSLPILQSMILLSMLVGVIGYMTQALGRLDMSLSSSASPAALSEYRSATSTPAESEPPRPMFNIPELGSIGLPRPVFAIVAVLHRAIIAVPRENTVSYFYWAKRSPAGGAGWLRELSGVGFGSQRQFSSELSEVNQGGPLGNSPLGMAADLFYDWSWAGVIIGPPLYALVFLALDMFFVGMKSPLLLAVKVFIFFSIPTMYSPFLFILYGGAVAVVLGVYVILLRMGQLKVFGLRPSQPPTDAAY